jgi:hypothetical protein
MKNHILNQNFNGLTDGFKKNATYIQKYFSYQQSNENYLKRSSKLKNRLKKFSTLKNYKEIAANKHFTGATYLACAPVIVTGARFLWRAPVIKPLGRINFIISFQ